MSSAADYQGRTVDIAAFHGAAPGQTVQLLQSFFPSSHPDGVVVTGIQKLVQRFLLRLMTPAGTVLLDPGYGTDFLPFLQTSGYRTRRAIEQTFSQAASLATAQVQEEEYGLPDDERLESVTLEDVVFGDDAIQLLIRVTSLAGDSYVFVEPLAIVY